MAQTKTKNTRNLIIGILVIALALVGLFNILGGCIRLISGAFDNSDEVAQYKAFIAPVIMNDPAPFDDVINADRKQLMSIAMWSLLSGDIDPDSFQYSGSDMLVSTALVEAEFSRLFGTDVAPVHQTVDGGDGISFRYDSKKNAYIVPITGIEAIYSPTIEDISEKGSTIILTVGYLASTDWTMDADGNMIPPEPVKYMRVYLRSSDEGYYISSIKDIDAPEVITTQQEETEATEETPTDSETKA